jgi:hypothetical protein
MMLHIYPDEDGDVMVEFVTKQFRCGLVLGKKQDECSWYVVTKRGEVLPDIMDGGGISQNALDMLRGALDKATR